MTGEKPRQKRGHHKPSLAATSRSHTSQLSDDCPKRTALITQKKLDNDGEWDLIVQYNQREGRRIASMAAQEINKKKEENKRYLDIQVHCYTATTAQHHCTAPLHSTTALHNPAQHPCTAPVCTAPLHSANPMRCEPYNNSTPLLAAPALIVHPVLVAPDLASRAGGRARQAT